MVEHELYMETERLPVQQAALQRHCGRPALYSGGKAHEPSIIADFIWYQTPAFLQYFIEK